MKHIKLYEDWNRPESDLKSGATEEAAKGIFYHGSTDKNLAGKKGIHIGTKEAATQALESRIGVPAEGEWDGTREYGKTLLAGKKSLETKPENQWKCTGFNCGPGETVPQEDYYPTQRKDRATYSDHTPIPFDCKPIVFPVKIIGRMSNSPYRPHTDMKANALIMRGINKGNSKSGFYYINDGEDSGSISAVVPDKSFLQIVESIKLENIRVLSKQELMEAEKVKEDILYHFTSVYGVVRIIDDKKLRSDINKDYLDAGNVSFTTDFNFYKKGISGFKPGKKAVAMVFDAKRMREAGIKMYYHVYQGTKDYDYSKEAEVRVSGEVSTKYLKEIIFIDKIGEKDPHFYKDARMAVKKSGVPYKIFK